MDALVGLLGGPRAQGAFLLRSSWNGPWSLRIADEAPLTVLAAPRGEFWITHDGHQPIRVQANELAITRGPDHYRDRYC